MIAGPLRFAAVSVAVLLAGCQPGATVKFSFENQATRGQALTLAGAGQTPTVFGVRLVVAYLVEDEAPDMNNVGQVGRIWVNPVCDADLHRCSIAPSSGPHQVTEYFDLALPTEEVNTRLNAQGHTVEPGTYRVLRLDLAGVLKPEDQGVPNLHYGMAGGTPSEVRRDNNYVVRLDPPLVLAAGDSVTLSLGYDIRDSYFADPSLNESNPPDGVSHQDWYCGDHTSDPARGPCLRFSGFSPRVSRTP
jgi:hypothetical protein